jgi:hypothetical protein
MTPYSQEYLGLLVRKNKLEGTKKDGKWFTTKSEIEKYLKKVAQASYLHQETLNVKIPAAENKKALNNLKWSLVLAIIVIVSLFVWNLGIKKDSSEYIIERDKNNNLIIHVDDPNSIGSVTVVPK